MPEIIPFVINPPFTFGELSGPVQASLLGPAGARLVAPADLNAAMLASMLGPAGSRTIGLADLANDVRATTTFTPTWIGFSAGNEPTVQYRILRLFNSFVSIAAITGGQSTGTSNSSLMGWSAGSIPAGYRPSNTRECYCSIVDAGAPGVPWLAKTTVSSDGSVSFLTFWDNSGSQFITTAPNFFQPAGTGKGLYRPSQIIYTI